MHTRCGKRAVPEPENSSDLNQCIKDLVKANGHGPTG